MKIEVIFAIEESSGMLLNNICHLKAYFKKYFLNDSEDPEEEDMDDDL